MFFFLSLEIKLKYYIENLPSDLLKINDQSMKSLNLLNRFPLNKNNVSHINIADTFTANAQHSLKNIFLRRIFYSLGTCTCIQNR